MIATNDALTTKTLQEAIDEVENNMAAEKDDKGGGDEDQGRKRRRLMQKRVAIVAEILSTESTVEFKARGGRGVREGRGVMWLGARGQWCAGNNCIRTMGRARGQPACVGGPVAPSAPCSSLPEIVCKQRAWCMVSNHTSRDSQPRR